MNTRNAPSPTSVTRLSSARPLAALGVAAALALGVASKPALAWGDREQGILTGIGATLLLGHIADQSRESRHRDYSVRHAPASVGYDHPGYGHGHYKKHHQGYHGGYSSGFYASSAPVTVVREVPSTVIIEREIVASNRLCREVPVKDGKGRVVEFRQLCD